MSKITINLTVDDYEAKLILTEAIIPLPFGTDWKSEPDNVFSEPSGKAANLLGDDDLSIIGSGARVLGILLNYKTKSTGNGERYDDGDIPEQFYWSKE
jgi:hypothetical protein